MSETTRAVPPLGFLLAAALVAIGGLLAALGPALATGDGAEAEAPGYIADEADSICGLLDVRYLSNPARVEHGRLIDATPEQQRIRREGIDPASPAGQILEARARRRVRSSCASVMERFGHCSVWKAIRRADGRRVPDITDAVQRELGEATAGAAPGR